MKSLVNQQNVCYLHSTAEAVKVWKLKWHAQDHADWKWQTTSRIEDPWPQASVSSLLWSEMIFTIPDVSSVNIIWLIFTKTLAKAKSYGA